MSAPSNRSAAAGPGTANTTSEAERVPARVRTSQPALPLVTERTPVPVSIVPPSVLILSCRASTSPNRPPDSPPTADPGRSPPPRSCRTALDSDPVCRTAARSLGCTASTSSSSGSVEYTPPATGSTSLSTTDRPIRLPTSSPRLTDRSPESRPTPAGSSRSTAARTDPPRPNTRRTSAANGRAGMPRSEAVGSGAVPRACRTQAPTGLGATIADSRPRSRIRSRTAGVAVA